MSLLTRLRGSVLTLLSGTALAQLILFAASPVLSRVYEPAAFGQYALLSLGLSLVTVLATGKYEIGVLLPEGDEEAFALVVLAGGVAVAVSAVAALGALLWLWVVAPAAWLGQQGSARYWLVPLAAAMVLLSAWQAVLFVWLNRRRRYRAISLCRITHAVVMVATQITLAATVGGLFGLLLGTVLGIAVCLLLQATSVRRDGLPARPAAALLSRMARAHANLPMHSIPTDLIGTLLAQFPVFFLGAKFSDATVGLYSLAQRTLLAPMQLISNSVGEVFRTQAASQFAAEGQCAAQFRTTVRLLSVVAVAAVLVVVLAGPQLFALVFGESWRPAGDYARIVIVLFALKFVVSPVSFMFIIVRKTRLDFWLHLGFLALLGLVFLVGRQVLDTVPAALALFVAVYSAMYLLYLALSWRFARGLA